MLHTLFTAGGEDPQAVRATDLSSQFAQAITELESEFNRSFAVQQALGFLTADMNERIGPIDLTL
jgi:hypothetical protein